MYNEYHINAESFAGMILPYNWKEISDYLNYEIDNDEADYSEDLVKTVWDNYWNGKYEDAPDAVSSESSDYELLEALDNAYDWNERFVAPVFEELCERTGINSSSYEDYDSLFNALKEAIFG